jgi:hypothetical protein
LQKRQRGLFVDGLSSRSPNVLRFASRRHALHVLHSPSLAPQRLSLLSGLLLGLAAQAQVANVQIGVLQGTLHKSAFENQQASGIRGVVTGKDNNGFWIQDQGDGNALTSRMPSTSSWARQAASLPWAPT